MNEPVRTIVVQAVPAVTYPELYNDIFVVGNDFEQAMFAKMFVKSRCRKAESLEKADLVVFTGGEDVDPVLYGEMKHKNTRTDPKRDSEDLQVYAQCYELGIPMLGICRGAQFGHVMNGGKLFQHVDGHYGDHNMYDVVGRRYIDRVSSCHHQMVIENKEMRVIAFSGRSRERWENDTVCHTGGAKDIEAFFYRDTCFLGIQGHPEYEGYHDFAVWTAQMIQKYVNENTDLELRDGFRRLKDDILSQREIVS